MSRYYKVHRGRVGNREFLASLREIAADPRSTWSNGGHVVPSEGGYQGGMPWWSAVWLLFHCAHLVRIAGRIEFRADCSDPLLYGLHVGSDLLTGRLLSLRLDARVGPGEAGHELSTVAGVPATGLLVHGHALQVERQVTVGLTHAVVFLLRRRLLGAGAGPQGHEQGGDDEVSHEFSGWGWRPKKVHQNRQNVNPSKRSFYKGVRSQSTSG